MRLIKSLIAATSFLLLVACQTTSSSSQSTSAAEPAKAKQEFRDLSSDPQVKSAAYRYLSCMYSVGQDARKDSTQSVHDVVYAAEQICAENIIDLKRSSLQAGANVDYTDGIVEGIMKGGRSHTAEVYLTGTIKKR